MDENINNVILQSKQHYIILRYIKLKNKNNGTTCVRLKIALRKTQNDEHIIAITH